jgi:hypothetical protein
MLRDERGAPGGGGVAAVVGEEAAAVGREEGVGEFDDWARIGVGVEVEEG